MRYRLDSRSRQSERTRERIVAAELKRLERRREVERALEHPKRRP